jgi:hypothetical protein
VFFFAKDTLTELLFDALLEETTEAGGTAYGPIILEAFHLGCGLKAGLKAPAQSLTHVRWMAISITNQFLPKGVLRDLLPIQSGKGQ